MQKSNIQSPEFEAGRVADSRVPPLRIRPESVAEAFKKMKSAVTTYTHKQKTDVMGMYDAWHSHFTEAAKVGNNADADAEVVLDDEVRVVAQHFTILYPSVWIQYYLFLICVTKCYHFTL